MVHLTNTSRSATFLLGTAMLMLFLFCAPMHAQTPTFKSTSSYKIANPNYSAQQLDPTTIGHETYRSTIYTPFGNGTPSSNNPSGNNGSGGSGDPNDDVGIPGWADTPSEPLPIGDSTPLFWLAAAMIAIIFIKQRRKQLQTQSINTSNNNDNSDSMHTTRHISSNRLQKLFLLLAFVCFVGQVSAEKKTIYFRPSTVSIENGYAGSWGLTSAKTAYHVSWAKRSSEARFLVLERKSDGTYAEYSDYKLAANILPKATNLTTNYSRFIPTELDATSSFAIYRIQSKYSNVETGINGNYCNCIPNNEWWNSNGTANKGTMLISMSDLGDCNMVAIREGYWATGRDDDWKGYYFGYYLEEDAHIYFDNKNGWTAPTFLRSKDIYAYTHDLTQISGTNLWYCMLAKPTKNDKGRDDPESGIAYTQYAFISNRTTKTTDQSTFNTDIEVGVEDPYLWKRFPHNTDDDTDLARGNRNKHNFSNLRNGKNYTETITKDKLSGKTNLYIPGAEDGAKVDKQTLGSWQDLNHKQNVTTYGGGSVTIASHKLNGATSTTPTNSTVSTGTTNIDAAYTATVTLTATPKDGYSFVGWYEGQNLVSKELTYTYTATEARNITAYFAEGTGTTTLQVRAMKWDGSTLVKSVEGGTFTLTHSGDVVYKYQEQVSNYDQVIVSHSSPVTFQVTINNEYEFIAWFNVTADRRFFDNPWVMEDPSKVGYEDKTKETYVDRFTAVFAHKDYAKKQNINIEGPGTVTANYTYYNTSTREVTFEQNSSFVAWTDKQVTLTANPLAGYKFDGWYEGGNKITTGVDGNTLTYTATSARTITAKFKSEVNKLSVSVLNYNPEYNKFEEYGYEYNTVTLTQGGTKLKESYSSFEHTFNDETTVTLTATPEEGEDGYDFVGWYINDEKLTKDGSNSLYTLASDDSKVLTINLSGEVAVNARFAPKKCWEVIIRNNIGGLYTVQYSRDENFTTYQTAESALDHYTYTHFAFGTTYVRVSPQPILGYKLLNFKVGGSTAIAGNTIKYGPTYDPEKHTTKKSQVVTNFVREDDQIVYLNLRGSGGNIHAEWATSDPNQHAYYAFVDNSFYSAKGQLQLKWIKMTHVQDYCYTCTIPGNMYNRISFVQIGKDSEGNFITNGRNDLPITTVNINFDTISQLSLNYVRDTLHLEKRRTSLTAIPATRNNCYRLNWSWNSSTQTNDHGWTEPPTQVGDFRLVYIEQTVVNKVTIREDYRFDNAGLIKKSPNTEDIISLHIYNKVSDGVNGVNNPEIILQKCTAIVDGKSQWEDIERHMVFGPLRTDDTGNIRLPGRKNSAGTPTIVIDKGIDNIKNTVNNEDQASGVWNFVIVQDGEGGATIDLKRTAPYEGEYYIRTTNAKGQYNDYTNPDNVMTLSKYAKDNSDYSHYFIRYVDINEDGTPTSEAGKHQLVKFAIANKHSVYLNNELMVNNDRFKDDEYESDIFVRNIGGAPNLPADASVRFGWDIRTNRLTRAYIANTTIKNNEYLVVEGDNIGTLTGDATYFTDNSNWLYSIDLPDATAGAAAKVKAKMNGKYQYFMGSGAQDGYETLISGNGANTYPIRLLYDFKDDRFTTIYQPASGTINNDVQLTTPLMIERVHNDPATQIVLTTNKITTVEAGQDQFTQPAYAVMTFQESVLADASKTHHEKMFYWISFPFDVKISDVFGLGDYGKYWIMEEYDGAQRAQSGLAKSNWKYITKKSAVLSKNVGYVLCLNYSQILQDQLFKSYGSQDENLTGGKLSLYFPSNGIVDPKSIVGGQNATIDLAEYYNANTAWNHHNWHIIGVPSFANPGTIDEQQDAPFVYIYWHPSDAYAAVSINEVEFQSMHAYMVQYAGKIKWTNKIVNTGGNVDPKFLAAKTDEQADKKIMLRLELQQAGSTLDKTYVQLRNDKGTKGFDMSLDLTKIINAGANIYSIVDNHEMAGNAIPKEETVLPLGVVITAAGEYTFAMPNGTEGMIVELIDYEQSTCTNLLVGDYTVNMPEGTNNTRFALRLKPDKVATSVEDITSGNNDNVRKLLIDGVLYLVKDGAVYDAQGHCVR